MDNGKGLLWLLLRCFEEKPLFQLLQSTAAVTHNISQAKAVEQFCCLNFEDMRIKFVMVGPFEYFGMEECYLQSQIYLLKYAPSLQLR